MARYRLHKGLVVPAAFALACASRPAPPPRDADSAHAVGEPVAFAFGTTSGVELSSATTRGRATVLLFVTTYDAASQLVAKRLDGVVRHFRPRVNAGAVVVEPPKYAVLADVFRSTLELSYPVAIADEGTRAGGGPFGRVDRVPTTVVLDRSGRVMWTKAGVASSKEIEQALAAASRSGFPSSPEEVTP